MSVICLIELAAVEFKGENEFVIFIDGVLDESIGHYGRIIKPIADFQNKLTNRVAENNFNIFCENCLNANLLLANSKFLMTVKDLQFS